MAKEYIEREAAKRELLSWAVCMNHPEHLMRDDALHIIDSIPAADVECCGRLRGVTYEDGKVTAVHIRDTDDAVKVFVPMASEKEATGMTREEAIKCIQEEKLRYERAPWLNGCPMTEEWQKAIDICDMALSALRAQQEQESKPLNGWISVKDRLPEKDENYIVTVCDEGCSAGEGIWYSTVVVVAEYYKGSWTWYDGGHEYSLDGIVTHWMPMPELPET